MSPSFLTITLSSEACYSAFQHRYYLKLARLKVLPEARATTFQVVIKWCKKHKLHQVLDAMQLLLSLVLAFIFSSRSYLLKGGDLRNTRLAGRKSKNPGRGPVRNMTKSKHFVLNQSPIDYIYPVDLMSATDLTRASWQATVHVVTRVRHDWVMKQQLISPGDQNHLHLCCLSAFSYPKTRTLTAQVKPIPCMWNTELQEIEKLL